MPRQATFDELMRTHHADIHRYLLRATGRISDAEDLTQETFLRAYRADASSRPIEDPRAWLFTLATNLCRNHFRSRKRRQRAYDAATAFAFQEEGAGPQEVTEGREMSRVVEAAVGALPHKQKLAFLQRKVHGFDYPAIGKSLGCSAESARAHVFQALKKIRQALEAS
jgi:RNA polymerase sigma-70 factor (ECF subfamily)